MIFFHTAKRAVG